MSLDRLSEERLRAIIAGTEGVTPGPWAVHPMLARVDAFDITDPDGGTPVCQMLWPTELRSEAETEANAKHIARLDPQTVTSMASDLLALRQERDALLDRLLDAAIWTERAEADLRLATQRREDAVEALRRLDITDAELLRIRNNCELVDQNGMIEIWAMMLQKLVDHIRDLRALVLHPKEN